MDATAGTVRLAVPAGMPIPTDRELSVIGSHIRPQPGIGYDERRYMQLWGRSDGGSIFSPTRAWGWDEAEVPFFEYSERSVPQSRRYLSALSVEKGRTIRPKLSLLLAGTPDDSPAVPVGDGRSGAARHRGGGKPRRVHLVDARC